jgi:hypothetical protein
VTVGRLALVCVAFAASILSWHLFGASELLVAAAALVVYGAVRVVVRVARWRSG